MNMRIVVCQAGKADIADLLANADDVADSNNGGILKMAVERIDTRGRDAVDGDWRRKIVPDDQIISKTLENTSLYNRAVRDRIDPHAEVGKIGAVGIPVFAKMIGVEPGIILIEVGFDVKPISVNRFSEISITQRLAETI